MAYGTLVDQLKLGCGALAGGRADVVDFIAGLEILDGGTDGDDDSGCFGGNYVEGFRDVIVVVWGIIVFSGANFGVDWVYGDGFDSEEMLEMIVEGPCLCTYLMRRSCPFGGPGMGT
jgi:hypothetical protein